MVMIGEVGQGASKPAQLFMYVEDAQYRRALEAGGTSLMAPCDKPWGDDGQLMVGAGVKDPADNLWFLAGPKSNPG
jgi:PhnB protein